MFSIEKPTADDAKRIALVHRKSWHETYDGILPREKIEEMLDQSENDQIWHFQEVANGNRPKHLLLLAKDENKEIVGFSDIRTDGEYADVKAIYILRKFQRQGMGTSMMNHTFEWLRSPDRIAVDIIMENRPAIRFFEKQGFFSSGNMESVSGVNITTLFFRSTDSPS